MKIDVEKSKIYSFSDPVGDLYMCGMLNTGHKGYFSNLPDFSDAIEGVLGGINVIAKAEGDEVNYFPFKKENEDTMADVFRFFCPEAYAVRKLEEPEFRPYKTLGDLPFKIGDSVTFREKRPKEEYMLTCSGVVTVDTLWLEQIHLGAHIFEPQDLFEDYEWFNGKEWVPFGAEA